MRIFFAILYFVFVYALLLWLRSEAFKNLTLKQGGEQLCQK